MNAKAVWKPAEAGPGDQHRRDHGHPGGPADLAHRLHEAGRQTGLGRGDAGQGTDLEGGPTEAEADPDEQERRQQVDRRSSPSAGTRVSHSVPAVTADRPVISSHRTCTRAASRAPTMAAANTVIVVVSQARPVFVGE